MSVDQDLQQHQQRTRAVRAAIDSDSQHGAIVPPIHLSSNFSFDGFNRKRRYDYTRSGNPTRDHLAEALTELEQGEGAVVTSTGMAAVCLVLNLLKPGDVLLAPHDCYGGTHRAFEALARKYQFRLIWNDFTDLNTTARVIRTNAPAIVWLETPSNPLLRISDIRAICKLAKQQQALVVADNTFLSPVLQQPIALGADIVVHSTTKYINGHSDVVGGAVVCRDAAIAEELSWWANCLGVTGAPFDSFLTLRGLRTIHVRLSQHENNAREIASFLSCHDRIDQVYYPGLSSHAGHLIAREQQAGFGAMISFELKLDNDRSDTQIEQFATGLDCFSLAESLGGVESLIAHPATMTHAAMSEEAQQVAGIGRNLFRLSIGIEHVDDLTVDLGRALDRLDDTGHAASMERLTGTRS